MALTEATVTFDLHQLLGDDFDTRRTRAYVKTNVESGTLMDTDTGETRLGDQRVTIASDGTGSFTTWAPGSAGNPTSWQTSLVVEYARLGRRDRAIRTFGPYTITTDADLTELEEEQAVPAEYLTTVTTALDGYVTDAEGFADAASASAGAAAASAAEAVAIVIADADAAMAAAIEDDASDTYAALSASTAALGYRADLPGYRLLPDLLRHWRIALAEALNGGSPAKLMVIGDSTSQGPATVAASWPTVLKDVLTARGITNRSGILTAATNIPDTRYAAPGGGYPNGWDRGNGIGPGGHLWYAGPAVSNPMYVAPGYAWNTIDAYYCTTSGGGTFDVDSDTIDTDGGTGLAGFTVTTSGGSGDNITVSAPTGGPIYMIGLEFVPASDKHVIIDNWAQSGATTEDWDTSIHSLAMVEYRAPDLAIIMLGTNDALTDAEDPSGYVARVAQIVASVQESGDAIVCSPIPVNPAYTAPGGTAGSATRQQAYREALQTWALANDVPYIDMFGRFGQYRAGGAYLDSVHQSDAMNHDLARAFASVLAP